MKDKVTLVQELVFLGITQVKTETHSASFSAVGTWLSSCVSLYIV